MIEHIYDIERFLRKLPILSSGSLSVFMASGANPYNYVVRKRLTDVHLKAELLGAEKAWGWKDRDCPTAFAQVRASIIVGHLASRGVQLDETVVSQWVSRTRGMADWDIRREVDIYLQTGRLPQEPDHPTNTCDPTTGNWAEHLMDPFWLAYILTQEGFETDVLCGYCGSQGNRLRRLVKKILNVGIHFSGRAGLYIAPFYALHARRR